MTDSLVLISPDPVMDTEVLPLILLEVAFSPEPPYVNRSPPTTRPTMSIKVSEVLLIETEEPEDVVADFIPIAALPPKTPNLDDSNFPP